MWRPRWLRPLRVLAASSLPCFASCRKPQSGRDVVRAICNTRQAILDILRNPRPLEAHCLPCSRVAQVNLEQTSSALIPSPPLERTVPPRLLFAFMLAVFFNDTVAARLSGRTRRGTVTVRAVTVRRLRRLGFIEVTCMPHVFLRDLHVTSAYNVEINHVDTLPSRSHAAYEYRRPHPARCEETFQEMLAFEEPVPRGTFHVLGEELLTRKCACRLMNWQRLNTAWKQLSMTPKNLTSLLSSIRLQRTRVINFVKTWYGSRLKKVSALAIVFKESSMKPQTCLQGVLALSGRWFPSDARLVCASRLPSGRTGGRTTCGCRRPKTRPRDPSSRKDQLRLPAFQ